MTRLKKAVEMRLEALQESIIYSSCPGQVLGDGLPRCDDGSCQTGHSRKTCEECWNKPYGNHHEEGSP